MSFVGKWMDLEIIIMLSEVSETQNAKYSMFLFICETQT
jgi:hypothetical protein